MLLEKGLAKVDATDDEGATALHWSIRSGKPHITRLLLDSGADITGVTNNGTTVVELLQNDYESSTAMMLIQNGAPYPRTPAQQGLVFKGTQNYVAFKVLFKKIYSCFSRK